MLCFRPGCAVVVQAKPDRGSMHDEETFLKDISAEPENDFLRLAFADWLEERDRPGDTERAEFIRVQCELAKMTSGDPRRQEFEKKEAALLKAHENEWARPLRDLVSAVEFRRGFPYHVEIKAASFLEHAENLFSRAPIQSARIINLDPEDVAALANSEHLRNLTSLNLSGNYIYGEGAAALANSECLRNLTSLDLSDNYIYDEGAAALANSEHLRNLTSLNLGDNSIGPEGAAALAGSVHLRNLASLDLSGNVIPQAILESVAQVMADRKQNQQR